MAAPAAAVLAGALVNAVVFDTLKLAQRLESAGFTREQAWGAAEALAEGLTGQFADLRSDVAALRSEVGALRSAMEAGLAKLEGELRSELASVRVSMVRWIIGAAVLNFVSTGGLVLVLLRFATP